MNMKNIWNHHLDKYEKLMSTTVGSHLFGGKIPRFVQVLTAPYCGVIIKPILETNHSNLEPQGQPFIKDCFNWMIPYLYIGNGCFTKHPFINGCFGFQEVLVFFSNSHENGKKQCIAINAPPILCHFSRITPWEGYHRTWKCYKMFLFQDRILRWTSLSSSRVFFPSSSEQQRSWFPRTSWAVCWWSSGPVLQSWPWGASDVVSPRSRPGIKSVGWKVELYLYIYIYCLCIYIYTPFLSLFGVWCGILILMVNVWSNPH